MTIPTKAWLYLCAIIIYTAAVWYHGYHTSDAAWQLKEAKQQKAAADAAFCCLASLSCHAASLVW